MTAKTLAARLKTAPRLFDSRAAEASFVDFFAANDLPAASLQRPPVRQLLLALADHSPYLWHLCRMDGARLLQLLDTPPDIALATCLDALQSSGARAADDAALMHLLRKAKQEIALLIALADLGGVWDVVAVTNALSHAADIFVGTALRFLLREAQMAGRLRTIDAADFENACGLAVLALGKHGANELNYSSDVDLIVLYDPESPAVIDAMEAGPLFVRLTKRLVRILQARTADGYVLRVDLRLRPDPGSTSIAVALPMARSYYEMLGQNWERAAMIKARAIAGDRALGRKFLDGLSAFVWRKYFDYAAIADIHAMKRQIHAVRGHADIAVAGHDVKLGRGGIREIEFFVQTQQLIFGGKRPRLRGARTLDMLTELHVDGWVTAAAVADLRAAYIFLREIEHRLQMVADEQTQRMPDAPDALKRFARFCGFARLDRFEEVFKNHLGRVVHHYGLLFETAPSLDAGLGSLVFTGPSIDPETLETLARQGFDNPAEAAEIVRGWHFGRRTAVQSARAREVLTELVPDLLHAFAGSGDPDAALSAFDQALAHMPAAVELFAILKSNTSLRDLFADVLGSAPRLARVVTLRPHSLDSAVDPAFFDAPLDAAAFVRRVAHAAPDTLGTEDFLDACRDVMQDELFMIGLRLLSGMIEPQAAGHAYCALAESLVQAALRHVLARFAQEHGHVQGGRCTVLALGKLGSREMTATSDLDLMLIYDFDAERPESDGRRPLHAAQYYTRVTQRLVSALTVATRRGRLYDVDMRLRPSGRQGPFATQIRSFVAYQQQEAEPWEHMALTRARPVAGDMTLAQETQTAIQMALAGERGDDLARAVFDMRSLIAKVKGESDMWDLKLASGGLMDIEFLAQYLQLRHAHAQPDVLDVSTATSLANARRLGLLQTGHADLLTAAYRLYTNVTQILRLTLEPDVSPGAAKDAVKRRLAAAVGLPGFAQLESELKTTRKAVRAVFRTLLLEPPLR